jgi:hypothetical protein
MGDDDVPPPPLPVAANRMVKPKSQSAGTMSFGGGDEGDCLFKVRDRKPLGAKIRASAYRYVFRLYAPDGELALDAGAAKGPARAGN